MTAKTTLEEAALIHEYIVLPFVLDRFERDKAIIERSATIKTPEVYVDAFDRWICAVLADIKSIKAQLRSSGVKVYESGEDKRGVHVKYVCRGYHDEFAMLWDVIKADTVVRMRRYLGEDISKYVAEDMPEWLRKISAPERL